jgi:hypothetical protein
MALPTPPDRSEVLRRIPSEPARRRLYAPSGGAIVDNAFLDLCLLEAWSKAHAITQQAFPEGLRNGDDSIDHAVLGCVVDLCNEVAARRHLNATEASGYFTAGKRAVEELERYASDTKRRRTQGVGEPTASVVAQPLSAPAPTPWADAANGRIWSL